MTPKRPSVTSTLDEQSATLPARWLFDPNVLGWAGPLGAVRLRIQCPTVERKAKHAAGELSDSPVSFFTGYAKKIRLGRSGDQRIIKKPFFGNELAIKVDGRGCNAEELVSGKLPLIDGLRPHLHQCRRWGNRIRHHDSVPD